MKGCPGLLVLSLLTATALAEAPRLPLPAPAPAAAAESPVQVRIEKINYRVNQAPPQDKYAYLKTNPALAGKADYTTEAVVLENEYLKAVVLPEFGARLPRVVFKHPGRDLFWVNDVLEDALPWSTGGTRFSFPYYEHGRHMDEGAGCRIVRSPDGSVTVAMDMRFSQYAGEVQRYGRFSALRQATYVTLRPGAGVLEYTARIDSRLPLAHGFRLWSVAHFPRQEGAAVLFPTGAVTDHGAPALRRWPVWDETDHSVLGSWGTSSFAVDMQGDWAGVYYPDANANHLVIKPRYSVLGTKLYAAAPKSDPDAEPGRGDAMIEIWNGSNPVFEHPGHFLPPFGTYFLPLKLTMVCGIGRIDWANDAVAVAYEPHDSGATIRVVGFQARPQCTAVARTKAETVRTQGTLRPDRPLVLELSKRAEPVWLTVIQGQDEDLAEISLPWKPQPTAPETFQALQGEMKPWTPVCMELSDWPREHAPNLAEASKALASALPAEGQAPTAAGVSALVQAARVVMRAGAPGSPQWKAVRRALEVAVFRGTKNRHAEALLGMMMALENGGKVSTEATKHLAQAGKLAGARYLLALEAIAAGNLVRAETLLKQCAAEAPPVAMGLGVDAIDGNDRLHPAALVGGQWPTMIGALLALAMERPASAITTLEQLTWLDPARPEAFAILADAYAKARQPDKAALARTEAEQLFRRNDQARRDYEALLREARGGVWSGIPRP